MAENVITDNNLIEELYNLESRIRFFNDEWDAFLEKLLHVVERNVNSDGEKGFFELERTKKEDGKVVLKLLDAFQFTIEKVIRGKAFSIVVYELLGNDIDGKQIKKEISSYKHMFGEGWENGTKLFASSPRATREFAVSLLYKLIEHVNK
ncbi:hypothetical protein [Serratia plymuthica]|uniref:hypothetical protein n=1 Tax=Serratia plymuthica TaxID=82996 RepID=UPI00390C86B3